MAGGLTCAANGPGLEVAANGAGFPANSGLDEPRTAAEIPRERRTRTSRGGAPSPQRRICLFGPVFCHGARGSQERGGEELLSKHFIQHRDRWRQVHILNDFKTGHRDRETQGF